MLKVSPTDNEEGIPNHCSVFIPVLRGDMCCRVAVVTSISCVRFARFCELVVSGVVCMIGVKCPFVPFDRMFSIGKTNFLCQMFFGRAPPIIMVSGQTGVHHH